MKILIVGGAGYIGGLLTDYLNYKGHKVKVFDKLIYEERFLKPVEFIYGDIRDTDSVLKAAQDCDVVVWLAALVGDPACSVDNQLTEELNYKAPMAFLRKKPKNLYMIQASTCSVYGAQEGLLNELSEVRPLSTYASTKLRTEAPILDEGGCVFRLGTVFGMGDTHSRMRMDLVVNVLTMKAVKYGEITVNGGEQWRPIIAVKDIANYVVEMVERKPNDLFVLSKENVSIKNLGTQVASIIPNTKINYIEMSFQDARNYRVDNSKALNYFHYKPNITVEMEVNIMKDIISENRLKNPEEDIYNNGLVIKKLYGNSINT